MTIEQALQEAAAEGRLSISVFPISKGYQANLSLDKKSWRVEMADDPATAMKMVLGLLPGASGPMREPAPSNGAFD